MQIYELIWVLLTVCLQANLNLSKYTSESNRIQLLKQILKEKSYMTEKEKRTSSSLSAPEMTSHECCPTKTEGIAPLGGRSREGTLLQLFRDTTTIQKIYQTTCMPDVAGKACRYVDPTVWNSQCEQQYTYTYAIVKDFNVTQPYRIDYIRVKSGCSCKVSGAVHQPEFDLAEEIAEDIVEQLISV